MIKFRTIRAILGGFMLIVATVITFQENLVFWQMMLLYLPAWVLILLPEDN